MLGDRGLHCCPFERAKLLLSHLDEDVGDGSSSLCLDISIGVTERYVQLFREGLAGFGLARSRIPHEHHDRVVSSVRCLTRHRIDRCSRYDETLREVSARLSPPNFSNKAFASTNATIASATTAAAGTAQTS